MFHDLFRTDGRGGVSAAVSELWGVRTAATPAPPVAPVQSPPVNQRAVAGRSPS